MVNLTRTTSPSTEPVSKSTAKDHLRVDFTNDDSMIERQIESARRYIEKVSGLSLIDQTWRWTRDRFPGDVFDIPRPPLQSVNSIKYTDSDGNTSTVSSSKYIVDTDSTPGRVALKDDEDWPNVDPQLQVVNGVEINFDAGYGSSASDVPSDLRDAILLVVGHLYENREWTVTGAISREVKNSVMALVRPHRVFLRSGFEGETIQDPSDAQVFEI